MGKERNNYQIGIYLEKALNEKTCQLNNYLILLVLTHAF